MGWNNVHIVCDSLTLDVFSMQLTQLPLDAPLRYSTERAKEALDAFFHNIGDVEFQENWGRVW